MNKPRALICGINPISCVVLQTICSMKRSFNLCVWNIFPSEFLSKEPTGTKDIDCSDEPLENLVLSNRFDIIFLCLPPHAQFLVLKRISVQNTQQDSTSEYPRIILAPPVSPEINSQILCGLRNVTSIAMPLRKLLPIMVLRNHLVGLFDRKPPNYIHGSSDLPSHWTLGEIRSIHIRLCTVNPVRSGQYSWICESGTMGGGLLNIYGAGVIDLLFVLTGGLRLTSVSCLRRTFDTSLCEDPRSIRRVSADDYILVTGELEFRSTTDVCPHASRGPVAMFCLSSELPQIVTTANSQSEHCFVSSTPSSFNFQLELSGSAGRFFVPNVGNRIAWMPVKSLSAYAKDSPSLCPKQLDLNEMQSDTISEQLTNGLDVHTIDQPTLETNSNGLKTEKKLNSSVVNVEKIDPLMETAHLISKVPSTNLGRRDQWQPETPYSVREAWARWIGDLSAAVSANKNTDAIESPKTGLNDLLADADHWAYIQRALFAIDKASRHRSWVDVATGERM